MPDQGSVSRAEAWPGPQKCVRTVGGGGDTGAPCTGTDRSTSGASRRLKNGRLFCRLSQMASEPTVGTLPGWPEGLRHCCPL